MEPKPRQFGPEFGSQFSDQSVVDHYHLRPPYPDAVFPVLAGLVTGLNTMGVAAPDGSPWTETSFADEMTRLGA